MSLTSFFSALSGLNSNSLSLNVIGNNLANVNTVGYKTSRTNFRDLLSVNMGSSGRGNQLQLGLGVTASGIQSLFTQGSVQPTGVPTDVAIQGNGFFVLGLSGGGATGFGFSRAGNFIIDPNGNLVNPEGLPVMGYPAALSGAAAGINTSAPVTPIRVPMGSVIPPRSTSMLQITANLNSEAPTGSTFNTPVRIFDSLGNAHTITFTFTKLAPAAGSGPRFNFDATIDGGEISGGTPGTRFSLLTGAAAAAPPGTITFDPSGRVSTITGVPTLSPTNLSMRFPPSGITFANGSTMAANQVTWNVYDNPTGDPTSGTFALTSFASPSTAIGTAQNGYGSGTLYSISITREGIVQGIFTNGQTNALAQIAIANFNSPNGLAKAGENLYFASPVTSGDPVIGIAGTGGRGTTIGAALELSNVDIAQEFTSMIVAQRGYQANSKMITTTDELMQETINLKR
jgi:flagellar hook protein FlgE